MPPHPSVFTGSVRPQIAIPINTDDEEIAQDVQRCLLSCARAAWHPHSPLCPRSVRLAKQYGTLRVQLELVVLARQLLHHTRHEKSFPFASKRLHQRSTLRLCRRDRPHPTLGTLCLLAPWSMALPKLHPCCSASERAIAIDNRSCLANERSRRSLRHRAAPARSYVMAQPLETTERTNRPAGVGTVWTIVLSWWWW